MATKKTDPPKATSADYDAALADFTAGVDALRRGDHGRAKQHFDQVRAVARNEPEMADRASLYAQICERKLRPPDAAPAGAEEKYHRAVFLLNAGDIDGALQQLNRALADNPLSVDLLYVRACAWAQKGAAEKAVGDLRQAMAVDARVRFQAVNDPDFERIREEPAFIDIVEPSPTGA